VRRSSSGWWVHCCLDGHHATPSTRRVTAYTGGPAHRGEIVTSPQHGAHRRPAGRHRGQVPSRPAWSPARRSITGASGLHSSRRPAGRRASSRRPGAVPGLRGSVPSGGSSWSRAGRGDDRSPLGGVTHTTTAPDLWVGGIEDAVQRRGECNEVRSTRTGCCRRPSGHAELGTLARPTSRASRCDRHRRNARRPP
jgi:hypothetical protein